MTGLAPDPAWTGPVRDATGGQIWRLPGTDWQIQSHPTAGIHTYLAAEGEPRRLVSIGFRSVAWAMETVRRTAPFFADTQVINTETKGELT